MPADLSRHLNSYAGRFYSAQALVDELYASLADRSTIRLRLSMPF
jgi:hypothetical protein